MFYSHLHLYYATVKVKIIYDKWYDKNCMIWKCLMLWLKIIWIYFLRENKSCIIIRDIIGIYDGL